MKSTQNLTHHKNVILFKYSGKGLANRIRYWQNKLNETQTRGSPMEYTFEEHVALLMKEHGVDKNKAKMMAWMEGPRKKEESK